MIKTGVKKMRCKKCNSLLKHPRAYFYECSNPNCDYTYWFDPSDPKWYIKGKLPKM